MSDTDEIIRVTKTFHFEMAHALSGYDGPCKNIHGHSYELSVTVIGKPESDSRSPKLGMLIDFSDLKKIVSQAVIEKHDHALVLNESSPLKGSLNKNMPFEKIVWDSFQPTCENLVINFAKTIKEFLPRNTNLHHLKLKETHTSYAEWYADDNS